MDRIFWSMTVSMLLAGCATTEYRSHACGIEHVEAKGLGLEVYFESDAVFNYFSVNRHGMEGAEKRYSVAHGGHLVAHDGAIQSRKGWHPFSPRHFFLDQGGTAGSFNLFGGCTYVLNSDKLGAFLHVQGADGDTSDAVYDEEIRPETPIPKKAIDIYVAYSTRSCSISKIKIPCSELRLKLNEMGFPPGSHLNIELDQKLTMDFGLSVIESLNLGEYQVHMVEAATLAGK